MFSKDRMFAKLGFALLALLSIPGNHELFPAMMNIYTFSHRNSKQVPPWKKNKWKHSYKSQANHITDTRKLIKTSWLSYEHRKNHIKHVYIAWDMSDKGQQGFEPQLYGINVDIQSSVVKQRSLVTQSIYLRIPLRQCFKTRLGLFIYLNIWKSFYWLLIRKVWISEQNTTEIVINF